VRSITSRLFGPTWKRTKAKRCNGKCADNELHDLALRNGSYPSRNYLVLGFNHRFSHSS